MSTADAVAREVAWLTAYNALDGLPALVAPAGPWDVVQAYQPRTPNTRKAGIYVRRTRIADQRFSNARKLTTYAFHLRCIWPMGTATGTGSGEAEQAAFDSAIDLLILRVRGLLIDHSHGGAFLSAAEAPSGTQIAVDFSDPAQTLTGGYLEATANYNADDETTI